jgi:hypothetical protein
LAESDTFDAFDELDECTPEVVVCDLICGFGFPANATGTDDEMSAVNATRLSSLTLVDGMPELATGFDNSLWHRTMLHAHDFMTGKNPGITRYKVAEIMVEEATVAARSLVSMLQYEHYLETHRNVRIPRHNEARALINSSKLALGLREIKSIN